MSSPSYMMKNFLDLIKLSQTDFDSLLSQKNEKLLNELIDHHKQRPIKIHKLKNSISSKNLIFLIIYIILAITSKILLNIDFLIYTLTAICIINIFFQLYLFKAKIIKIKFLFCLIHFLIFEFFLIIAIFIILLYEKIDWEEKIQKEIIFSNTMFLLNILSYIFYFSLGYFVNIFGMIILQILIFINIFYYISYFSPVIISINLGISLIISVIVLKIKNKNSQIKKSKYIFRILIHDCLNLYDKTLKNLGIFHVIFKNDKITYTNFSKNNFEEILDLKLKKSSSYNNSEKVFKNRKFNILENYEKNPYNSRNTNIKEEEFIINDKIIHNNINLKKFQNIHEIIHNNRKFENDQNLEMKKDEKEIKLSNINVNLLFNTEKEEINENIQLKKINKVNIPIVKFEKINGENNIQNFKLGDNNFNKKIEYNKKDINNNNKFNDVNNYNKINNEKIIFENNNNNILDNCEVNHNLNKNKTKKLIKKESISSINKFLKQKEILKNIIEKKNSKNKSFQDKSNSNYPLFKNKNLLSYSDNKKFDIHKFLNNLIFSDLNITNEEENCSNLNSNKIKNNLWINVINIISNLEIDSEISPRKEKNKYNFNSKYEYKTCGIYEYLQNEGNNIKIFNNIMGEKENDIKYDLFYDVTFRLLKNKKKKHKHEKNKYSEIFIKQTNSNLQILKKNEPIKQNNFGNYKINNVKEFSNTTEKIDIGLDLKKLNNISIQIEKISSSGKFEDIKEDIQQNIRNNPSTENIYNQRNIYNNILNNNNFSNAGNFPNTRFGYNNTFKLIELMKNKFFIEYLSEIRYPLKGFNNILQNIFKIIQNVKEIYLQAKEINEKKENEINENISPYNIAIKKNKNNQVLQIDLKDLNQIKNKLNLLNTLQKNFIMGVNQIIGFSSYFINTENNNINTNNISLNCNNNLIYFNKIKEDLNYYKFDNLEDDIYKNLFDLKSNSIIIQDIDLFNIITSAFEIIKSTNNAYNNSSSADSSEFSFNPKLLLNDKIKNFTIKSNETFFKIILYSLVNYCMKVIRSGLIILEVDILYAKSKLLVSITTKDKIRKNSEQNSQPLDSCRLSTREKRKSNFNENHPNLYISKLIAEKLNHNIIYEPEDGKGDTFIIEMNYDDIEYILDKSEIDYSEINNTKIGAYQGIDKTNDDKLISNSIFNSFSNLNFNSYIENKGNDKNKTIIEFEIEDDSDSEKGNNRNSYKNKISIKDKRYSGEKSNIPPNIPIIKLSRNSHTDKQILRNESSNNILFNNLSNHLFKNTNHLLSPRGTKNRTPKNKLSNSILNNTKTPRTDFPLSTKAKILIIDDNRYNRKILKNCILEANKNLQRNFDIVEGKDGLDILNFVVEDNKNFNSIKCIFTDEIMDYIDGSKSIEILKQLENNNKIKKIYMVSVLSLEDEGLKEGLFSKGFDLIMSKPLINKEIEKIIERLL